MINELKPEKPYSGAKVAVALACYNGARYLVPQIESILSQANVQVTIFVRVDSSRDDTDQICRNFASQDPRIILLEAGPEARSAASNFFEIILAIPLDKFDFLALSDQDDLWCPSKLERAVYRMGEKGVDGYSSDVLAFWPNGEKKLIKKSQPQVKYDFLFEGAGPGCTFVVTNILAKELQAFLLDHYSQLTKIWMHDWFIYAFARTKGFVWHIDESADMLYRQHESNAIGANVGPASALKRLSQAWSGIYFGQSRFLANMLLPGGSEIVGFWNGKLFGYLRLAMKCHQCRRKKTEQYLFFLLCVSAGLISIFRQPYKL